MDYIEIKGEKHPFWFAVKAQREFEKSTKPEDNDDIHLIYLGLKYGAIKDKKEFPYTENALIDIFEDDMDAFDKASDMLGSHLGKLKKIKAKAMKFLQ